MLELVALGQVRAMTTTALFLEYEAVLKRPEQRLAHGFSMVDIDGLLRELAALLEPVEIHFSWRPQLTDPGDEMVLEAAVNGRADALITYNVRDFTAASRFGITVIRPSEFVQGLKS